MNQERKIELLQAYTSNDEVIEHIMRYCDNKFTNESQSGWYHNKGIVDHPSVQTWSDYASQVNGNNLFTLLKTKIVQFQFPILKGISETETYKKVTKQGFKETHTITGLDLQQPEKLTLSIHLSLAGNVPVLIIPEREDFKTIIRAMLYKNEPYEISNSIGAVMVAGFNNWDRIHQHKKAYLESNPLGNWANYFKSDILPRKELYQDQLILLSRSFYSNVSHTDLGIEKELWLKHSLVIRLEHECTHLFTKQCYGHMSINMYDELIADYMGISKVLGQFNAAWFLKFVGLEDYPKYRKGGRMENYVDKNWTNKTEFSILSTIVYKASQTVEKFDRILGKHSTIQDRKARLISLCCVDLLTLSSAMGIEQLLNYHAQYLKPQ